jgi:hypothetical protein
MAEQTAESQINPADVEAYHTLSFSILDDCEHEYGPINISIPDKNISTIETAIKSILNDLYKSNEDPSGYYARFDSYYKKKFFPTEHEINEIAQDLSDCGYYVINRFEKYYVIAYALDFTRFEIFSKDCDKELIIWPDSPNGKVIGLITDPDYNENPVIKLMNSLC